MAKTTQPLAGERDPLLFPSSSSAAGSPPPYLDHHPADSYAVLLVPVRLCRRLRRGGRCVRVRNPDFFALDYSRLDVDIGYRGSQLGRVTSGGGRVRARAVSYVDADLELNGIRVVEDAIYLIEDLARGSVPFDTVVEVEGHLHLFFLSVPVKVRAAETLYADLITYIGIWFSISA
ncbi:hypothetical protein HU200_045330 [Digitaria exilis]|uniref:Late embryogenesis abundant protein LEA-2 subgroup domain-containing protein n=1 Tax=Digitaria exilis TaxID=1010633 RepID=A0A835EDI0_9POAL|nr:hypothetical protein HU200_045330 [Digitaria exilis]